MPSYSRRSPAAIRMGMSLGLRRGSLASKTPCRRYSSKAARVCREIRRRGRAPARIRATAPSRRAGSPTASTLTDGLSVQIASSSGPSSFGRCRPRRYSRASRPKRAASTGAVSS